MKRKIAAIDVGTTKVCTIMGTLDSSSGLRVLGVGIAPSRGIDKAIIANVTQAKESIKDSIKKAETMAGYRLDSAYVGVSGKHISSMNSRGAVAITKVDQKVRGDDLKHVLDVALNVQAPADRKMLHVIPRAYTLDGHEVKNPVGMYGYELDVEAHVITASMASVQNLTKCIQSIGIEIDDLVLEPLASAEAVLTEQEKQAGVLLADIGGGTTDVAVVKDGSVYHTSVLPVAGQQITKDIASGLGFTFELAEETKKQYGSIIPAEERKEEKIEYENGDSVSYGDLSEIISARAEELIRLILLELPHTDNDKLIPAGIVLTGGTANLPGIAEMAQSVAHLPVRIGVPPTLNGVSNALLNDPAYAASVGLILWKMKNDNIGTNNQKWTNESNGFAGRLSSIFRIFR